jgi:hypothetical protein
MDINEHIYLWVNEIYEERENTSIIIDGIVFDEELGFGKYKRNYNGEIICLSNDRKVISRNEISTIHISHVGLKWIMKNNKDLPIIPFLLTDNINLKLIYDGNVQLNASAEMEETIQRYPQSEFAVYSSKCIGIIKHNCDNHYIIKIFSETDINVNGIHNEEFQFSEWDWKIGKISKIDHQ